MKHERPRKWAGRHAFAIVWRPFCYVAPPSEILAPAERSPPPRAYLSPMLEFDFEKDCDAEPGAVAKLVTLLGLALLWVWVFVLIF